MKITKETKIKDLIPEGYEYNPDIKVIEMWARKMPAHLTIPLKKKEKTPEQLANDLSFQLGYKVWNSYKQYCGIIKAFYLSKDKRLCVYTDHEIKNKLPLEKLTHKVTIHCPTKEDKLFIMSLLKYDKLDYFDKNTLNNQPEVCIDINRPHGWIHINSKASKKYLILSIDEYMQSQGIKPLWVTSDKKNIYEGMEYWYYSTTGNCIMKNKAIPNGLGSLYETFSTEQAAEQYLENLDLETKFDEWKEYNQDTLCDYCENFILGHKWCDSKGNMCEGSRCEECDEKYLDEEFTFEIYNDWKEKTKILFYCEDFPDGSFPVKDCSNCKFANYTTNCHPCNMCIFHRIDSGLNYWQGKLKGESIKKGDKCYMVWIDSSNVINLNYREIIYNYDDNKDRKLKYFSNETNARNYYLKLQLENKPKLEVGKWYQTKDTDKNGDRCYLLYEGNPKCVGFNFGGNWLSYITAYNEPNDIQYLELADMDKVTELLLNYVKKCLILI